MSGHIAFFKRSPIMNNKSIISKLLLIIVFPCILYADTCFVASGQTVAFTLSAGAKASWNNTISGIHCAANQIMSLFSPKIG
jgi:hypothetical protein